MTTAAPNEGHVLPGTARLGWRGRTVLQVLWWPGDKVSEKWQRDKQANYKRKRQPDRQNLDMKTHRLPGVKQG